MAPGRGLASLDHRGESWWKSYRAMLPSTLSVSPCGRTPLRLVLEQAAQAQAGTLVEGGNQKGEAGEIALAKLVSCIAEHRVESVSARATRPLSRSLNAKIDSPRACLRPRRLGSPVDCIPLHSPKSARDRKQRLAQYCTSLAVDSPAAFTSESASIGVREIRAQHITQCCCEGPDGSAAGAHGDVVQGARFLDEQVVIRVLSPVGQISEDERIIPLAVRSWGRLKVVERAEYCF